MIPLHFCPTGFAHRGTSCQSASRQHCGENRKAHCSLIKNMLHLDAQSTIHIIHMGEMESTDNTLFNTFPFPLSIMPHSDTTSKCNETTRVMNDGRYEIIGLFYETDKSVALNLTLC